MIGITSLIDCDRAMYSASVDDNAISVCIFDAQCMGRADGGRPNNPGEDYRVVAAGHEMECVCVSRSYTRAAGAVLHVVVL